MLLLQQGQGNKNLSGILDDCSSYGTFQSIAQVRNHKVYIVARAELSFLNARLVFGDWNIFLLFSFFLFVLIKSESRDDDYGVFKFPEPYSLTLSKKKCMYSLEILILLK